MLCLNLIVLCLCIKILSRECNNPRFYPFLNTQTYDLIQLEPFLFLPSLKPKKREGVLCKKFGKGQLDPVQIKQLSSMVLVFICEFLYINICVLYGVGLLYD